MKIPEKIKKELITRIKKKRKNLDDHYCHANVAGLDCPQVRYNDAIDDIILVVSDYLSEHPVRKEGEK